MKKIISIFLGICMLLTLNVVPVMADSANPITRLMVGEEVVVSVDPMEVTATSGTGWSYSEGILTIENFLLESNTLGALIDCYGDLVIEVKGVNTLTTNNPDHDLIYGIKVVGALTIRGGGTLNINMSLTNPIGSNYPILSEESITINDSKINVNNTVVSDNDSTAGGICAHGGIIIKSSEVISNVNGLNTYFGSAIETRGGNIDISGGSKVNGIINGHMSVGVIAYGDILVNNSNLYGEGRIFGIAAMLMRDNRESRENSANLIIQITDSAYKVEGKALASVDDMRDELPPKAYKPMKIISSAETVLTPDSFTVADVISYVKKYMTEENMIQYYDFESLQEFLESYYEGSDFSEYASLDDIYQGIEEVLNWNLPEFGKYEFIPMAINVNSIQYNSEVKVLTPTNGFTGKVNYPIYYFNDDCETVFAALGELPTLHAILGIPRTPVVEGTTDVGTQATVQRVSVVAGAVETGDMNLFNIFAIGVGAVLIGTAVMIKRKKA